MIKFLNSLSKEELKGKKVFLRVDFNVSIEKNNGKQSIDIFKIEAVKKTINFLINAEARIALVSHITAIDSFETIISEINNVLDCDIFFVPKEFGIESASLLDTHQIVLLDNIRFHKEEAENEASFAATLAAGFDIYVNDAFAVSHRKHASISAITKYLPSYAGQLMFSELEALNSVLNKPVLGKVLVLGGAKATTKIPVIKNFLDKAEYILVGGVLANTFLAARGISIGASLIDNKELVKSVFGNEKIILPVDVALGDQAKETRTIVKVGDTVEDTQSALDIGPETIEKFITILKNASIVIWNGPMGMFEYPNFINGTKAIADSVVKTGFSLVGGGETIAALRSINRLNDISYISTGGGAMLMFLAGDKLAGLTALGYYD